MLGVNMKNIDAAGGNRPGAGGYVIRITKVTNRVNKQDIEIEYDIAEGEYKDHYQDLFNRRKFWGAKFYKSYKDNALPFLRAFLETIIECNDNTDGLVIGDFEDIDETKLVGKTLGLIYGLEEYIGNDGKKKTRPDHWNAEFVSPDIIRGGEFTVPELKPLEGVPQSSGGVIDTTINGFTQADIEETPF